MSKSLEKTFNLPEQEQAKDLIDSSKELKKEVSKEMAQSILDEEHISDHDRKMDEFSQEAHQYAKDIMDLGMDVEARHAAEMFNAAANMIKIAHDSKNSKIDKRLKLYELELKRQKLEIEKQRYLNFNDIGDDGSDYVSREDLLNDDED